MKLLREYIKILLEANEYSWFVSSKKRLMLDKPGMEKLDKDNVYRYLKDMKLIESSLAANTSTFRKMKSYVILQDRDA